VLAQYVQDCDEELDQSKLSVLLGLKYGAIHDAIASLGQPDEISSVFVGFQRYLNEQEGRAESGSPD
jgi:type I restriction enzyme R subunit